MKRIGILGGSYNPIHVGHIQLAEHLLRVLSFDEVWLLVSPHNPLKPANDLLPDAIRYQWVTKSIEGMSGLVASDFELALPQPHTPTTHSPNSLPLIPKTSLLC